MWISRLELTNFKSYAHQVFEFPRPVDGKNIVLIGGLNGYGKTTILEAIYLCLYGKDAISHLARAGLKADKGYPTFLEKALNGEAQRAGRFSMTVQMEIHLTKRDGLLIKRRWFFKNSGNWDDEEAIIQDTRNGVAGSPRRDGENENLAEVLDSHFVPAHIAPFFFFDGEEVKRLADQSRVEQIKQGMEGLLGVVLLRNLSDRLRTFEQSRRSEVSSVDEVRVEEVRQSLERDETSLEGMRTKKADLLSSLQLARDRRQLLLDRITTAGGGGGDVATAKDILEEKGQLEQEHKQVLKQIETLLCGVLPFHLVPRPILDAFQKRLLVERRIHEWETEKRSLQPKKETFRENFFDTVSPVIDPPLAESQVHALQQRLETAWQSLFYPPPDGADGPRIYPYLHEALRDRIIEKIRGLRLGAGDVLAPVARAKQIQTRIRELQNRLSKIEGIERDGTLSKIRKDLEAANTDIDALGAALRDTEREEAALMTVVSQDRATYERAKNEMERSSPTRSMLSKSERVRAVIEEVIPALFPLKSKELARAMTDVYKSLAHKDQVKKIEIDEDGTSRILSKGGNIIEFDRSAGENQIFATALIAGLAKISGIKAPLVVDTPLGRLDSKHRKNILTFWISDPNRQVILLSQDEEIDSRWYKEIRPSVGKTYLLDHEEIADGVGRSRALEGEYFNRVRA